ncbi:MAG: hypothetical protein OK422_06405 [Thaumarchaeota archaeon]|nr:hypothetical protein [Nitrososphaerota archaeon]
MKTQTRSILILGLTLLLIGAIAVNAKTFSVTVKTDKTTYVGSASIHVSGTVTPAPGPNTAAFVRVSNPNKSLVLAGPASVNATTGSYSFSGVAGGNSRWITGTYLVNVTWGAYPPTIKNTTAFFYSPRPLANTTLTTSLSATTIAVGNSAYDTATLSGGSSPGGTVTYQYFQGATCTGTPTAVGTPLSVANGVVPNSNPQPFNSTGSFSWSAMYSGDANNAQATSPCEPLTVTQAASVLSTTLSASSVALGGSVHDTATLSSITSTASGNVTYSYYSNGACSGTGTTVGSAVSVTNGVVPNSASQTFQSAGSFSWHAVYSGDSNNAPATSPCELLAVTPASTTTTSSTSSSSSTSATSTTTSTSTSSSSTESSSTNYLLYGGLAAVAVVVILALVLLRRRK